MLEFVLAPRGVDEHAGTAGLQNAVLRHKPLGSVGGRQQGPLAEPEAERPEGIGEVGAACVKVAEGKNLVVEPKGDALAVAVGGVAQELVEGLVGVVQSRATPDPHHRRLAAPVPEAALTVSVSLPLRNTEPDRTPVSVWPATVSTPLTNTCSTPTAPE